MASEHAAALPAHVSLMSKEANNTQYPSGSDSSTSMFHHHTSSSEVRLPGVGVVTCDSPIAATTSTLTTAYFGDSTLLHDNNNSNHSDSHSGSNPHPTVISSNTGAAAAAGGHHIFPVGNRINKRKSLNPKNISSSALLQMNVGLDFPLMPPVKTELEAMESVTNDVEDNSTVNTTTVSTSLSNEQYDFSHVDGAAAALDLTRKPLEVTNMPVRRMEQPQPHTIVTHNGPQSQEVDNDGNVSTDINATGFLVSPASPQEDLELSSSALTANPHLLSQDLLNSDIMSENFLQRSLPHLLPKPNNPPLEPTQQISVPPRMLTATMAALANGCGQSAARKSHSNNSNHNSLPSSSGNGSGSEEMDESMTRFNTYHDCGRFTCHQDRLQTHFHCNECSDRVLTRREEMIRHSKWHKKRRDALRNGFMRFSAHESCGMLECPLKGKQTHYHCIRPDCGKILISTSDIQMHHNRHLKEDSIDKEGFKRFKATENCGSPRCQFVNERTMHFHCARDNCDFVFKNKSEMEKHKNLHAKNDSFEHLGFKKYTKHERCDYPDCRYSRNLNHIHCNREGCNYVVHSSSQIESHNRKHMRSSLNGGSGSGSPLDAGLLHPSNFLANMVMEQQRNATEQTTKVSPAAAAVAAQIRVALEKGELGEAATASLLLQRMACDENSNVRPPPQLSANSSSGVLQKPHPPPPPPPPPHSQPKKDLSQFAQEIRNQVMQRLATWEQNHEWRHQVKPVKVDEEDGGSKCVVVCSVPGCYTEFSEEKAAQDHCRHHAMHQFVAEASFLQCTLRECLQSENEDDEDTTAIHFHCKSPKCVVIIRDLLSSSTSSAEILFQHYAKEHDTEMSNYQLEARSAPPAAASTSTSTGHRDKSGPSSEHSAEERSPPPAPPVAPSPCTPQSITSPSSVRDNSTLNSLNRRRGRPPKYPRHIPIPSIVPPKDCLLEDPNVNELSLQAFLATKDGFLCGFKVIHEKFPTTGGVSEGESSTESGSNSMHETLIKKSTTLMCVDNGCAYHGLVVHYHCVRPRCHFASDDIEAVNLHRQDFHQNVHIEDGYEFFSVSRDCRRLQCPMRQKQNHFHCVRVNCDYTLKRPSTMIQHSKRHQTDESSPLLKGSPKVASPLSSGSGNGLSSRGPVKLLPDFRNQARFSSPSSHVPPQQPPQALGLKSGIDLMAKALAFANKANSSSVSSGGTSSGATPPTTAAAILQNSIMNLFNATTASATGGLPLPPPLVASNLVFQQQSNKPTTANSSSSSSSASTTWNNLAAAAMVASAASSSTSMDTASSLAKVAESEVIVAPYTCPQQHGCAHFPHSHFHCRLCCGSGTTPTPAFVEREALQVHILQHYFTSNNNSSPPVSSLSSSTALEPPAKRICTESDVGVLEKCFFVYLRHEDCREGDCEHNGQVDRHFHCRLCAYICTDPGKASTHMLNKHQAAK